jgi:hypothetical protein
MPRFPNPAASRAVLIGAVTFPHSPDLPALPSVHGNLAALADRLAGPHSGVFAPGHCVVLADPPSVSDVGRLIHTAAEQATDLLLVYYAGHGMVDDRGRLYLAVPGTDQNALRYSAIPVELLREDIAASPAAARVLVLDCCFSGRAIEAMTDQRSLVMAQLDVAGTYTLTSSSANTPAFAPAGDPYTAFTGALVAALDQPKPLSLNDIYSWVDRALTVRGLPRPQRRATNTAGELALVRGPSHPPPDTQPPSSTDQVVFAIAPGKWAYLVTVLAQVFHADSRDTSRG